MGDMSWLLHILDAVTITKSINDLICHLLGTNMLNVLYIKFFLQEKFSVGNRSALCQ